MPVVAPVGHSALLHLALALTLLVSGLGSLAARANAEAGGPCDPSNAAVSAASAAPVTAHRSDGPPVAAAGAAVIDGDSGALLLDIGAHRRLAPASTTKMLTAKLALEHGDLDRVIISQTDARAMTDSSVMGLYVGAPITVRDLLYGLMLPSGNDAAIELAIAVAGDERAFVGMMNEQVRALGLTNTNFVNPHGLDDANQYSTAYDLAMIGRYAMGDPEFVRIASTPRYRLPAPFDYDLINGNSLLGSYPGAEGVKIGWTDAAGWTFVASATRDGHRVFAALLDTEDRDGEAGRLLDWTWQSYRWDGLPGQPPTWVGSRPLSAAASVNAVIPCCKTPGTTSDAGIAGLLSGERSMGLRLREILPAFHHLLTKGRLLGGGLDRPPSLAATEQCDESAIPWQR